MAGNIRKMTFFRGRKSVLEKGDKEYENSSFRENESWI